jgi:hypothetical protein
MMAHAVFAATAYAFSDTKRNKNQDEHAPMQDILLKFISGSYPPPPPPPPPPRSLFDQAAADCDQSPCIILSNSFCWKGLGHNQGMLNLATPQPPLDEDIYLLIAGVAGRSFGAPPQGTCL